MKMYFEEPQVRVEKFTAESVMEGEETIHIMSLVSIDVESNHTQGIFARPY